MNINGWVGIFWPKKNCVNLNLTNYQTGLVWVENFQPKHEYIQRNAS